ncbi:MAG: Uma2 family endonuclease [Chloroflexi bacterium]|nr:Uma2 family endonuclease [Chloroflexota bacterium]
MDVRTRAIQKFTSPMTYEPYRALPEDGNRYQVIEGELHMIGAPRVNHQRILHKLVTILDKYIAEGDWGELFIAPIEVYLDEHNFLLPDLVCVAKARLDIVQDKGIVGAPDLVIEVLSPSTVRVDRVLKMNTYARHQVPHYWIVDPAAQTLEAFEWENGAYRLIAAHAEAEDFQPALFSELTIHLAELWK